jgi:hypothetical protein
MTQLATMPGSRVAPLILIALLAVAAIGLSFAGGPRETVLRDIDGVAHGSLERPSSARWNVLFFLTSDCPVANQYAPEIKRICMSYGPAGVHCFLVYVDASMTEAQIRQHVKDFQYDCCTPIHDGDHRLVHRAGANVSSEVAVFSNGADLKYRGRIDNFYAALGTSRQHTTQHDLRDALEDLAAGRPVRETRSQAIGCFINEN